MQPQSTAAAAPGGPSALGPEHGPPLLSVIPGHLECVARMDDRAHAFTQCHAYGARVVHIPGEQQECRDAAARWIRDKDDEPDRPEYTAQSAWDAETATLCMYLELPPSAARHAGTATVVHRAMHWDTLVLLARIPPPNPAACDQTIARLGVVLRPDTIDNVWHVLRSTVVAALRLLGNLFPQQWPPPEFEWVVTMDSTTNAGEEFGPFEHSLFGLFSARGAAMRRLYDPAVTTCFLAGLAAGMHHENVETNDTIIRPYHPMLREVEFVEATLRKVYNPMQAQRYAVWEAPLRSQPVRIVILRRHTGRRIVRNYDALLEALQQGVGCGQVEVVEIQPGLQAPEEYVPIVNTAHMLLGMHGAGLTNAVLLPRGSVLLELTHKESLETMRMYSGWAAMGGVAYAHVSDSEWVLSEGGETFYKERDYDIIVDVEKVLATVRALVLTLLRSDSACLQQWGPDTRGACKETPGCMWCDDCAIAARVGGAATGWVRQPEAHPSQEVMLGQLCVVDSVELNSTVECP